MLYRAKRAPVLAYFAPYAQFLEMAGFWSGSMRDAFFSQCG